MRGGDRLLWVTLFRRWTGWRSALVVLKPDTIVRWHREGWRRYWRWKSRQQRGGRRRIAQEARELIARIAREHPRWGAVRIRGELLALGHHVSAASVRRYRRQALRRPPSQRWQTFITNHRHDLWAVDFFTVPTLLFQTLYVFVVVSHDRGVGLAAGGRGDALGLPKSLRISVAAGILRGHRGKRAPSDTWRSVN